MFLSKESILTNSHAKAALQTFFEFTTNQTIMISIFGSAVDGNVGNIDETELMLHYEPSQAGITGLTDLINALGHILHKTVSLATEKPEDGQLILFCASDFQNKTIKAGAKPGTGLNLMR